MKWNVGAKIGAGFGTALVILVIVGAVSYRSTTELTEANQWVAHTYEVLQALSGITQAMIDAETGQRGYIITGEEAYLEPFAAGAAAAPQAIQNLKQLTSDNPQQQRRIEVAEELVGERLTRLQGGIDVRKSEGLEAGRQWILSGKGKIQMDELRDVIAEIGGEENRLLKVRSQGAESNTQNTRLTILLGTLAAFVISSFAGFLITRSISKRLREVTTATRKVAEGNLTGDDLIVRSQDEIGGLATAFNRMRTGLKEMAGQIRQATENVNSTAAEILASTQQQAAAAKEQAATIQEITSTLEEVNQSGGQIGERAKQVSTSVEGASNATQRGMKAMQETSQTMEAIRDQVEEVAENVVSLSERTQTIGEIIATVSEIAEQSNLLALNASIEAVSAGDQGSRFSVVAHEMKNLADRAKECTVQVRTILSEIQKGINSSVMLTEEAVKRADSGKQQAHATEATIREVTETNDESLQAFQQIVAGTSQQQIGVGQVTQGMQDIRQAIKQTAAGTSQLEKAAANMNALSQQLQRVVEQYRV